MNPNLHVLEQAVAALGELMDELVLVGGCAVGLLITDPGAAQVRPTRDVDWLTEVTPPASTTPWANACAPKGLPKPLVRT